MSSRLPLKVRNEVKRLHEISGRPGTYKCAGYGRTAHGSFSDGEYHIDHEIPETDGGDVTAVGNLQLLCKPCHKRKTAYEARERARRPRRGRGTWADMAIRLFGLGLSMGILIMVSPLLAIVGAPAIPWWVPWALVVLFLGAPLCRAVAWWVRKGQDKPESPPAAESEPIRGRSDRVLEAAREVMGPKGEITVTDAGTDEFTIAYPGTGFADHVDERRVDLLAKVSAKVGGRWKPTWDTENDTVTFHRRPELPPLVPHPGFPDDRPWNIIPVAQGVEFDLLNTAHILVQGATGSGKTVLLRAIIAAFSDSGARGQAEVYIGDPKRIEMLSFRGKPGITKIATSDEDLWQLPLDIRDEMMRRYDLIEAGEAVQEDFTPLLLVIDEYEEFVERMRAYYIESGLKKDLYKNAPFPPSLAAMASILRMARKCHIHVVIGTQRPDADFFGGRARDNLQGRAGVGRLTPEASRMCFGRSDIGRDVPVSAKGRATFQVGDEEPVEAQTYWLPE